MNWRRLLMKMRVLAPTFRVDAGNGLLMLTMGDGSLRVRNACPTGRAFYSVQPEGDQYAIVYRRIKSGLPSIRTARSRGGASATVSRVAVLMVEPNISSKRAASIGAAMCGGG